MHDNAFTTDRFKARWVGGSERCGVEENRPMRALYYQRVAKEKTTPLLMFTWRRRVFPVSISRDIETCVRTHILSTYPHFRPRMSLRPPPLPVLDEGEAQGASTQTDAALIFTPRAPAPSQTAPSQNEVTIDSLDEETQEGNSHTRRRHRCTPLCVCVPATFITLFVVFVGTLAGAIISWHQYERPRLHDTWFSDDCTVVSKSVRKSNDTDRWRPQAQVNISTTEGTSKVVTAFWGRSNSYILSKSAAQTKIDSIPEPGQGTVCYVQNNKESAKVSMEKITQKDVYLNMAWGSSFFAAVSGFLLLTLAVNFVQRALVFAVTGRDHGTGNGSGNNGSRPKRAGCLSPTQTRWVVAEFGESVGAEKLPADWTCSICLEEVDSGMHDKKLRVVVLPCSHRFHTRCIRRWLRRGSPTCPLCNFDVSSLFNEEGLPVDADGNAINSPANTNNGNTAVVDLRYGVPGQ